MEIRVGDITGERNPKIDPHCIISEKETEKKRENVKICASLLSNRKKKRSSYKKRRGPRPIWQLKTVSQSREWDLNPVGDIISWQGCSDILVVLVITLSPTDKEPVDFNISNFRGLNGYSLCNSRVVHDTSKVCLTS